MTPLRLLTGTAAAIRDWANGGRRAIPCRSGDGMSTLTYGEVRRAAVALHGPGTRVRIRHDGSGHLLPPPPYREEEWLYSFGNESQLRRLLPSLGVMTQEEWEGRCPVVREPRSVAVYRTDPHETAVKSRPPAKVLCRPCYRAIRTAWWLAGDETGLDDLSIETATGFADDPEYERGAHHRCLGGCVCLCRREAVPGSCSTPGCQVTVTVDATGLCFHCRPDRAAFAVGDRVRRRDGQHGEEGWPDTGRIVGRRTGELCGETVVVRWDGEAVRESWCSVTALESDPPAARPGSLDLSSAHEVVASWPEWKQELAKQILRPSKPPAPRATADQTRALVAVGDRVRRRDKRRGRPDTGRVMDRGPGL